MRVQPEAAAVERLIERVDSRFQPCSFDGKPQILDAELKQSLGGPASPWESSFRHGRSEYAPDGSGTRWASDKAAWLEASSVSPHFVNPLNVGSPGKEIP